MLESLSIGVLQPWGFALMAPILGALFYAYLRRRKLRPVVIPSLFLLQDLARPVSTRQRFVPPPRFWFELLLLSLLVISFAGLFRTSESKRYALLIDNSLSSAYLLERRPTLDVIKEHALAAAGNLPSDALFDVYRGAPELERIGGAQLSANKLTEALTHITPAYANDSLTEQLPLINQRGDYAGVVAFTDHRVNITTDAKFAEAKKNISVHVVEPPLERLRENLALTRITFESDISDESTGTLKAQVISYAKSNENVDLIIDALDSAGKWTPYKTLSLEVPAGESREFSTGASNGKAIGFRARIEAEGGRTVNQLAEDDLGYFAFRKQNKVVYVVSARSLDELGIEKIRGISFKQISPSEFTQSLSAADADTYLFVDFIPDGLPEKNLVIISPPHGSGGFDVGNVVPSAEVSEWITGHPLLTYIEIATLRFSKFIELRPALWSQAIVSTNRGVAMIAGERGKARIVVTGFDLFPYRGRTTPTISVLFLNMLRWVSAGSLSGQLITPYSRIPLAQGVTAVEKAPDQFSSQDLQWQAGSFRAGSPGIYQVRFGDKQSYGVAVNYYSDRESNPRIAEENIEVTPVVAQNEKLQTKRSFSDFFIPLVLLLLLGDLLIRSRRFVRGAAR